MVKKKVQGTGIALKKNMIIKKNQISLVKQCDLLNLARSTYYYEPVPISDEDLNIMGEIDKIYMEFPYYGARKMSKELKRRDLDVGRKHAGTLMKKMGISALYQKKNTSKPHPGHKKYPYLLREMKITKPNQVWCADITYIKLKQGFVYLVAIMDWYSRYVLSWRLSTTMDGHFCCEALQEAMTLYGKPEIFNTDQGSQFTGDDFTGILEDSKIKISMDGRGRWLDNVFIERLWRNLKYEDIYRMDYCSIIECRSGIRRYFEKYNNRRLHEALGYQTPAEYYFEKAIKNYAKAI